MDRAQAIAKFYDEFTKHREAVKYNIDICLMYLETKYAMKQLAMRAENHDKSKVEDKVEFMNYVGLNMDMDGVQYGTERYQQIIVNYSDGVQHHYENNEHHPEHYSNGIKGMSQVDLIEMVADWAAVIKIKGLQDKLDDNFAINKRRFHIEDDLFERIMNTAKFMIFDKHELKEPNLLFHY